MVDTELVYLNAINDLLKLNLSELPSDLKPKNEVEFYLAKIFNNLAGINAELPSDLKPSTRKEILLAVIEQNSRNITSGGGGVVPPPSINPSVNEHLKKLLQFHIPIVDVWNDGVSEIGEHTITVTKVADDVYFGPEYNNDFSNCENEVFVYNDNVLHIHNGNVEFNKTTIGLTQKGIKSYSFANGDVYTLTFNDSEAEKVEAPSLKVNEREMQDTSVKIGLDTFGETLGFTNNGTITVNTDFKHSCYNVTNEGDFTIGVIDLSNLDYNNIKSIKK